MMCSGVKPCNQDRIELICDSSFSREEKKVEIFPEFFKPQSHIIFKSGIGEHLKNLALFKICNLYLYKKLLKRTREDPLSVKNARYIRIMLNVFVLRCLTVTFVSTVPLLKWLVCSHDTYI